MADHARRPAPRDPDRVAWAPTEPRRRSRRSTPCCRPSWRPACRATRSPPARGSPPGARTRRRRSPSSGTPPNCSTTRRPSPIARTPTSPPRARRSASTRRTASARPWASGRSAPRGVRSCRGMPTAPCCTPARRRTSSRGGTSSPSRAGDRHARDGRRLARASRGGAGMPGPAHPGHAGSGHHRPRGGASRIVARLPCGCAVTAAPVERAVEAAEGRHHDWWLALAALSAIRMGQPSAVLAVLRRFPAHHAGPSVRLFVAYGEALEQGDPTALVAAAQGLETAGYLAAAYDAAARLWRSEPTPTRRPPPAALASSSPASVRSCRPRRRRAPRRRPAHGARVGRRQRRGHTSTQSRDRREPGPVAPHGREPPRRRLSQARRERARRTPRGRHRRRDRVTSQVPARGV